MSVLRWDKPEQIKSTEEWRAISADSAPPGVYMTNMSDEDQAAWKAKLVGHKSGDPRVEIRKRAGSLMLIVVRPYQVVISANGKIELSGDDWRDMSAVVVEASMRLIEITDKKDIPA